MYDVRRAGAFRRTVATLQLYRFLTGVFKTCCTVLATSPEEINSLIYGMG